MATTVRIPLSILTVQPDSANAYYVTSTRTNLDISYIQFVDSGNGACTYWGKIPNNVASTPAWNLDIDHEANSGSGGNAVLTINARTFSNNTIDVALTRVLSAGAISTNTAGTWTYTAAVSGGNFDSVVAVSANNFILIEVNRHGGNSNDTLNAHWNLNSVAMRIDVA